MAKSNRLPPARCEEIIAKARKIANGEALGFSRDAVSRIKRHLDVIDAMDRKHFTRKRGFRFFNGNWNEFKATHDSMVRRLFGAIVGVESPSPDEPAQPAHQLATTEPAPVSTKRVSDADRLGQLNRDLKSLHSSNRSKS